MLRFRLKKTTKQNTENTFTYNSEHIHTPWTEQKTSVAVIYILNTLKKAWVL